MELTKNRRKFMKTATLAGFGLGLAPNAMAFPSINLEKNEKRVGIIGLDTSHSVAFTKAFNAEDAASDLGGFKVTAAYPYGSRD
ncbi:MAG: twin-arginine translocation signal domain-containing protein, partial [Cyclobacteriaceae bacterium]